MLYFVLFSYVTIEVGGGLGLLTRQDTTVVALGLKFFWFGWARLDGGLPKLIINFLVICEKRSRVFFIQEEAEWLPILGSRIARFLHILISCGLLLIHIGISLTTALFVLWTFLDAMDGLDALECIFLLVLESLVYLLEHLMLNLACEAKLLGCLRDRTWR